MDRRSSCWLIPAESDYQWIQREIDIMAERFGAPKFEPHLTLFSPIHLTISHDWTEWDNWSAQQSPLVLSGREFSAGDIWSRSLVWEIVSTPALQYLRSEISQLSSTMPNESYHPHVSILYHVLPHKHRKEILASLSDWPPITFDRISMVSPALPHSDWQQVESWETLWTGHLGN
ncbi:hypothetical protein [Pontibacter sp. G13]|uniref:hypothetical protein n=1 Tax=Pontibacter sp. G13 TaxID=3074898 RepID=UPI00288A638E|nr:hypothetical protein [Pontibacter sp. G13]WNJ16944.1 hypothetical protein RJD25_18990 [Pontibacter sp. G13]